MEEICSVVWIKKLICRSLHIHQLSSHIIFNINTIYTRFLQEIEKEDDGFVTIQLLQTDQLSDLLQNQTRHHKIDSQHPLIYQSIIISPNRIKTSTQQSRYRFPISVQIYRDLRQKSTDAKTPPQTATNHRSSLPAKIDRPANHCGEKFLKSQPETRGLRPITPLWVDYIFYIINMICFRN